MLHAHQTMHSKENVEIVKRFNGAHNGSKQITCLFFSCIWLITWHLKLSPMTYFRVDKHIHLHVNGLFLCATSSWSYLGSTPRIRLTIHLCWQKQKVKNAWGRKQQLEQQIQKQNVCVITMRRSRTMYYRNAQPWNSWTKNGNSENIYSVLTYKY